MSLPKRVGRSLFLGGRPSFTRFQDFRSKDSSFSNAKLRPAPGGSLSAMAAASISSVPPPHMGSKSGSSNFQPLSLMIPAARFSRNGASTTECRQPRLNSGSPEVSR